MEVLDTVKGLSIDIMGILPVSASYQYPFGAKEHAFITEELTRLLDKGVIVRSGYEDEGLPSS